jgi:curved DNA-binding protein CbpA
MNHYQILGINENANKIAIKKAYKTQSILKHPDKGGKNEEFIALKNAYDTLIDDSKKYIYDLQLKPKVSFANLFINPFFNTQNKKEPKVGDENLAHPKNFRKRWTSEEEQLLLFKINENKTVNIISREMGRTIPSIRARSKKLGKIAKEEINEYKEKMKKEREEKRKENEEKKSKEKEEKKESPNVPRAEKRKSNLKNRRWESNDEVYLKNSIDNGTNIETISQVLKRTVGAVKARISKLRKSGYL